MENMTQHYVTNSVDTNLRVGDSVQLAAMVDVTRQTDDAVRFANEAIANVDAHITVRTFMIP